MVYPGYNGGMLTSLLQGLTLGFAAGAQPGPFQTYIISQSISRGWRKTSIAAFAPLVSDGPIVAIVLLLISQVPEWFQRVLQIAGGLFALYLAWRTFQAWRVFSSQESAQGATGPKSLLHAGLANALSPGPYLFWSLVMGPLILQTWKQSCVQVAWIVLGFYIAMIGLNFTVILIFGQAARLGDRVRRAMLGLSSLALAGFGLYQFWMGVFR